MSLPVHALHCRDLGTALPLLGLFYHWSGNNTFFRVSSRLSELPILDLELTWCHSVDSELGMFFCCSSGQANYCMLTCNVAADSRHPHLACCTSNVDLGKWFCQIPKGLSLIVELEAGKSRDAGNNFRFQPQAKRKRWNEHSQYSPL
jgi:hypothetical protein